jgi:hypothetical protein
MRAPPASGQWQSTCSSTGSRPLCTIPAHQQQLLTADALPCLCTLPQGAIDVFTPQQVLEAAQIMASYSSAIDSELAVRRRAVQLLEKIIEHQVGGGRCRAQQCHSVAGTGTLA